LTTDSDQDVSIGERVFESPRNKTLILRSRKSLLREDQRASLIGGFAHCLAAKRLETNAAEFQIVVIPQGVDRLLPILLRIGAAYIQHTRKPREHVILESRRSGFDCSNVNDLVGRHNCKLKQGKRVLGRDP
jgi:hypothetical protein